jgi:hypothetical protein
MLKMENKRVFISYLKREKIYHKTGAEAISIRERLGLLFS